MYRALFLICCLAAFSTSGQNVIYDTASTPKIIVVPSIMGYNILKEDSNTAHAVNKIREELIAKRFHTIDFIKNYNSAIQRIPNYSSTSDQAGIISNLVASSEAEVRIEVVIDRKIKSGQNSITLMLTAIDIKSGSIIGSTATSTGYFETNRIDKLIDRAISNVIPDFANTIQKKHAVVSAQKRKIEYRNKTYFIVKRDMLNTLQDASGKEILPFKFIEIYFFRYFDCELPVYDVYTDDGRKKRGIFMDEFRYNDKLLFDEVQLKSCNCIAVKDNGLYGFMDTTGSFKIPIKFTGIHDPFSGNDIFDNVTIVYKNNKAGLIDSNCSEIVAPLYDDIGYKKGNPGFRNFIPVILNKKYGAISAQGKVLIEPIYDDFRIGSEGNALVRKGGLYGIISFKGQIIKPVIYQSIQYFNGNYYVKQSNKYGLISFSGKDVLAPVYDTIQYFTPELYLVKRLKKIGLVSKDGIKVVDPIYDEIRPFESNTTCVRIGIKWGMIDNNGSIIISPKYDQPFSFVNGIASVSLNGNAQRITARGDIVYNDFQDSDFSQLNVGGYTVRRQIEKKFEELYTQVSGKQLYGSLLGVKVSPQQMITEGTKEIKRTVEGWLNGSMTPAQNNEFVQIQKNAAAVSNLVMSMVVEQLKSSNSSSSNPGYGKQIGNANRTTSTSSNSTSSQICPMCKPSNPKGHQLRDYYTSTRTYGNFRYVNRPGYKICQSCWGTSLQNQTGPQQCNQCNGERFKICTYCKGTGQKK